MVQEYRALMITDAQDLRKNSGNPAFEHPNSRPVKWSNFWNTAYNFSKFSGMLGCCGNKIFTKFYENHNMQCKSA